MLNNTRKITVYVNTGDAEFKKECYKRLRDYQYLGYKYANEVVKHAFFADFLKNGIGDGKQELTGKELTEKLISHFGKGSSIMNFGYKFASEQFNILPSKIKASINNVTYSNYNSDKKEVLKGNRSVRTYKRNMPVPFMKEAISNLKLDEDGKNFTFDLFSPNSIPMKTTLGRDRSDNFSIIENIINGTYHLCNSSYTFKDNKMILSIVFKTPIKINNLDEEKILGVDLGINHPIVAVCGDKPFFLGSKEDFLHKRLAIQNSKRNLQKNLIFTSGGRGRNKKLKALENYSEKEANFAKTYNNTLSRMLINIAKENKCKYINIEDLSSFKENANNWVLRNWSYAQLQEMITYKAEREGIIVRKVNPQYTSQCCSKCGHIDSNNRQTQADFICTSCGHELNADVNGAINISNAHEEYFIKRVEAHKKELNKNSKKLASLKIN
jgi:putative transposase